MDRLAMSRAAPYAIAGERPLCHERFARAAIAFEEVDIRRDRPLLRP